jgi:hypothetical protein
MDLQLKKSLDDFVIRAKGTMSEGIIVDRKILAELNDRLGNLLPDWFIDLLSTYPLTGATLNFPFYNPSEDYDGCITIEFAGIEDIFTETAELFPGVCIKELGYFCFGTDPSGGGDPFFMQNNKGGNPPVYQVYHDVSDEAEEIEEEGMEEIADSLSDFFAKARVVK